MAWLNEWLYLLSLPNVRETFTASCSFGSIFQKEFRFLTVNMLPEGICRPCTRDHQHVKIEGSLTKGSAIYCEGLVTALGELFQKHLVHGRALETRFDLKAEGLESILTNDVACNAHWKVESAWKWKGLSHINIFELASALQVLKKVAREGGGRFVLLLDSFVALRAYAKGRSASKALAPLLRKIMALSVAFDCYGSGLFCPTRHNPSDDPTRSHPLRKPCRTQPPFQSLESSDLFALAELPKLRRWISNWACLVLGLSSGGFFSLPCLDYPAWRLRSSTLPIGFHEFSLDFDATLGYPGEGPPPHCHLVFWFLNLTLYIVGSVAVPSHGLQPRNANDEARALRRGAAVLDSGRPVLPVTKSNREKLLQAFGQWCSSQGFNSEQLLADAPKTPERLVHILVKYGQELFSGGRPYHHYAETINAIGSKVPAVRRLMSGAWDFAFTWLREEPFEHHLACPPLILLALVSTALVWGWPQVAGAIALSWSAITRIGEVISALRGDLVLPKDVGYSTASILFRIQEPKTRFRAARHQVAKTDYPDMIRLISAVVERLRPHQRLWPFSGQTLRTRFRQLLAVLGLPTDATAGGRALDLGSLRAGGATHLLSLTEDSELVRRRGRWISSRTMEVYLQEAAAVTYFPSLPEETKTKITHAAELFPTVLERAIAFLRCSVPSEAWWYLFTDAGQMGQTGGRHETAKNAVHASGSTADRRRGQKSERLNSYIYI